MNVHILSGFNINQASSPLAAEKLYVCSVLTDFLVIQVWYY